MQFNSIQFDCTPAAFAVRTQKLKRLVRRAESVADAMTWHLRDREAPGILAAIKHLTQFLRTQFTLQIKILECENEFTQASIITNWVHEQGIKMEHSAPDTPAQNGGAERWGGVIKEKARAMAIGARLPWQLWPEITRAAVYLHNRTPRLTTEWKTPLERFHSSLVTRGGLNASEHKPHQGHLKVYGFKAFAMTDIAKKKQKRLERLRPRSWIGYLVGYDSSNIYRIWNPGTNQVVRTRDVIFDEQQVFPGNKEDLAQDLSQVDLEELKRWLQARHADDANHDGDDELLPAAEEAEEPAVTMGTSSEAEQAEVITTTEEVLDTIVVKGDASGTFPEFLYPTPPPTPPAALMAAAFVGSSPSPPSSDQRESATGAPRSESEHKLEPWQAAFHAGTLAGSQGGSKAPDQEDHALGRTGRRKEKAHARKGRPFEASKQAEHHPPVTATTSVTRPRNDRRRHELGKKRFMYLEGLDRPHVRLIRPTSCG